MKKQAFFQNKIVSATIRLHQLKSISQNGVPLVDKGLLVCYNMGNLRYPQTKNSIIEEGEAKKYISNLDSYPLPLDVALPIFDWYILFDGNQYKGLIREFTSGTENTQKEQIHFAKDTIINGYSFKAGQWLRHEQSEPDVVKACAEQVSKKLKGGKTKKFLIQNASIKRDEVIDVIGNSHLRDRDYSKAIEWLSKAGKLQPMIESQYNYQTGKKKTVNVDLFLNYKRHCR